jgi:hypothetical protein
VIQKSRARAKRALRTADPGPTGVATEVLSFTRATAQRTPGYPHLAAVASVVRLDQGLYALEIGGTFALPDQISGLQDRRQETDSGTRECFLT